MRAACKKMSTVRDTTVNLVDDACAKDMQNLYLPDESEYAFTIRRPTRTIKTQNISLTDGSVCASTNKKAARCKRKKKRFEKKGSVNKSSSDIQHFMNVCKKWNDEQTNEDRDDSWKLDNSEKETRGDQDNDWTQIAPREKRNLGLPFVVDMPSHGVTSINLPQIFKREQTYEETTCDDAFELSALFNKNAGTSVAKSVNNSEYNTDVQIKHPNQVLFIKPSVPLNVAKNDESKDADNRIKAINVDNVDSPVKSPVHEKLIEDGSPRSVDYGNNAETGRSSECKNISSCQRVCNQKSPKVYCIRNIVIVIMESRNRFCFTGKLLVKVLYGAVQIYGAILNESTDTKEVYSPYGYGNVTIETSGEFQQGSVDDVWTALAAKGITRDSESELQINVDNVKPGMAVLMLQNFENNLTLFLKTYFTQFTLFPNVKNLRYFSWTDHKRAEIILQAKLHLEQYDDFNYRRLITNPCISTTSIAVKMLNSWGANEWSCTLIAGAKSVGKSTNVRYLINSLLRTSKKVVLVDVDPGQAECTPPGCISYSLIEEPLLGPNFTHLKTPVYQLFIDDVDVSQCVTRYLQGIKMLVEKLKECPILSHLPIVVNTMGFTKEVGWNIMIFTIKLIRPSIILQIMSTRKKNNYKDFLSSVVINEQECSWTFCDETFIDWNRPCEHDLCIIYSQAEIFAKWKKNERNMEPYQQRELAMISYLSDMVPNKNDFLQHNTGFSLSINEAVPYTAPFSSLCIIPQRLFGIPASHALSIINGNIVALCGIDLTEESSQSSRDVSNLQVLTQRSPLCTCYGFGIIRGVDMERQEVFINTPLSMSIMQHVNCLAGCIGIPPALLQLHQGTPYVGGNAELPTSREPRRGKNKIKSREYRIKPSKP